MKIVPKASKEIKKADILLRWADYERGENNNKNVTLLKSEWFVWDTIINSPDLELVQRIKDNTSYIDKLVKKALDARNKEWRQETDRLIYWQHRLYVPQSNKLREDIIKMHYGNILAGHSGYYKTLELINHNYWWPCITKQIQTYIIGCNACQRTKAHHKRKYALLNPNKIFSAL